MPTTSISGHPKPSNVTQTFLTNKVPVPGWGVGVLDVGVGVGITTTTPSLVQVVFSTG
jgi:hypothetical protein